ncbi:hypothetical protein LCGC14_1623760 [marine sediment metagenome]|uniref:Uncharacterized protein n=1 Tax=marine sediment metagenome TaxID=412755 RepID=A0A0F9L4D3_9ZZZZ
MKKWGLVIRAATDAFNKIPLEKIFVRRDPAKDMEELRHILLETPAQAAVHPPENPHPSKKDDYEEAAREPEGTSRQEDVATACVPCALGHFSTSTGLLNEAVRFKKEGLASNEIVDRIGKVLEEQNTLERVDLTPERIQSSPPWERGLAEEALQQSRSLRHRLEGLNNMEELQKAAADTAGYYRRLNREWYRRLFSNLGADKAEAIASRVGTLSPEDRERVMERAEALIEEA